MVKYTYVWLSSDIHSGSDTTRSGSDITCLGSNIEFNNRSGILLLRFGFSDRIQMRIWVSDKMSSPNKLYEYEASLIDIHIIYIYIYIIYINII